MSKRYPPAAAASSREVRLRSRRRADEFAAATQNSAAGADALQHLTEVSRGLVSATASWSAGALSRFRISSMAGGGSELVEGRVRWESAAGAEALQDLAEVPGRGWSRQRHGVRREAERHAALAANLRIGFKIETAVKMNREPREPREKRRLERAEAEELQDPPGEESLFRMPFSIRVFRVVRGLL